MERNLSKDLSSAHEAEELWPNAASVDSTHTISGTVFGRARIRHEPLDRDERVAVNLRTIKDSQNDGGRAAIVTKDIVGPGLPAKIMRNWQDAEHLEERLAVGRSEFLAV